MNEPARGKESIPARAAGRRTGLGSRPVVSIAFGFSAALHAFFIVAYPLFFRQLRPEAVAFPLASSSAGPEGIDVIRIVEVNVVPDARRPEEPVQVAPVQVTAPELGGPVLADAGPSVELVRPGQTAAERLRPNPTDARLWAPLPPEFSQLTLEQREELLVAGRLTDWYDSVAATAAADAAWKDWTFTDGSGGRWGVSPGQLHLGKITIPLPFAFDAPPGQRDYMRQWDEMARQGANAQVQQTVRDRMEAIRARRDRERAAARADTTSTPN
jgi:hypothetical protein